MVCNRLRARSVCNLFIPKGRENERDDGEDKVRDDDEVKIDTEDEERDTSISFSIVKRDRRSGKRSNNNSRNQ